MTQILIADGAFEPWKERLAVSFRQAYDNFVTLGTTRNHELDSIVETWRKDYDSGNRPQKTDG